MHPTSHAQTQVKGSKWKRIQENSLCEKAPVLRVVNRANNQAENLVQTPSGKPLLSMEWYAIKAKEIHSTLVKLIMDAMKENVQAILSAWEP